MSERYVRPTIAGWLAPTLIAPWISSYASVAAFLSLGVDFGKWHYAAWVVGLIFAGVFAFCFSLTLMIIDLLLLAVRIRTFPTGKRSWLSTMGIIPGIFGVYSVVQPHKLWAGGAWTIVAALAIPMVVGAVIIRVVAGRKPLR